MAQLEHIEAIAVEADRNAREFHHSMKRRCFAHDYKSRSIYMVTLEVKGRGHLTGVAHGQ